MHHQIILRQLLAWAAIALLSGCSGGSSSTDPVTVQSDAPRIGNTYRGQALLGPLAGAEVHIYRLPELSNTPLYTTTTATGPDLDSAGVFTLPTNLIEDGRLYLAKVSGGTDLDADDDGIADTKPTANAGTVHAVLTASQLRGNGFHVSAVTEIVYQRLRYLVAADYPSDTLLAELDRHAALLLKRDVDGDGDRDRDDIAAWHPRQHREALAASADALQVLNTAIHQNRNSALSALTFGDSYVASMPELRPRGPIVVKNDYLYVMDNRSQLIIIDLSSPSQSHILGQVAVAGHPDNIIVENNRAYLWGGEDEKVYIVDVARPEAPAVIGNFVSARQFNENIAAYGNYLYSAHYSGGLKILDATDPTNVTAVNTITFSAESENGSYTAFAWDVVVQGSTAYVATKVGIWIYDLTTPSNPARITKLSQTVARLHINGGTLYGVRDREIVAIDIRDPLGAQVKAVIPSPIWINDIAVIDRTLYISSDYSLMALDISDMNAPVLKGSINNAHAYHLATWGDYLLAMLSKNGIKLITANAFTTRQTIAAIDEPDEITDIAAQGSILYTLSGYSKLRVIDVGDPLRPDTLSTLAMQDSSKLTLSDTRAVVTGTRGIDIIDSANPRAPRLLNQIKSAALKGGVLKDGFAYLVDGNYGLNILDLSTSPATLRSTTPLGDNARYITLLGTRAAIIDDLGVRFIDVTDPDRPRLLGSLPHRQGTFYGYTAIVMQGDYAYALETNGIHIIDLRDPLRPLTAGEFVSSHWLQDIGVAGRYAYVARYNGLEIVDIGDPSHPIIASTLPVTGLAHSIRVTGNSVFLLMDRYTTNVRIQAVDITDTTQPRLSGILQLPDGIDVFDTSGNELYVGSGKWIYRLGVGATFPTIGRYVAYHNYFTWLAGDDGRVLWPSTKGEVSLVNFHTVTPSIATTFDLPLGSAYNAVVLDELAYILDSGRSLKVMDIAGTTPELVTTLLLHHGHYDAQMIIQGTSLVIASESAVSLFDLSDRKRPRLINSIPVSGRRSAATKTIACTLSYPQIGTSLFTIHDLVSSAILSTLTLPLNEASVFVEQDIAYIPTYEHGILAIDVRDPARPQLLGTIASRSYVRDLVAIGELLYIADNIGIYVVKRITRAMP